MHTHSTYATSFAQAKRSLPAYGTTHADTFYGAVPCTRELTDEEITCDYEKNTGLVIVETIKDPDAMPAVLVASHGPFAWGKSPVKAVENILILEETSKMALLTSQLQQETQPVKNILLDKHYLRKHGKNAYYGQQENIFSKLLKGRENCPCGRSHHVPIKEIVMKSGALASLPCVIQRLGEYHNIYMICDTNTYEAAGKTVEELLHLNGVIHLDATNLHANEHGVALAENVLIEELHAGKECDLLLAVGSGTVHDITRYIAYNRSLPFVSVPTAPSVDGYVSNVAAMTLNGLKVTVTAVCPVAMVADTDVLMKAPMRLIASGFGDLLGKYTALADWQIAHLLTGEYYCEKVADLEYEALKNITNNIEGIRNCEPKAIEALMYGLVLSGVAMQMVGFSRPASGSEHHISHFIEMNVLNKENSALHGEKVGVGLALVSDKYHATMLLPDLNAVFKNYKGLPIAQIQKIFGPLSEKILIENKKNLFANITKASLLSKMDEIRTIIERIPTGDQIRQLLKEVGAPSTLSDIGLDNTLSDVIVHHSPFIRNRLTFMRIITLMMDTDKF